MPMMRNNHLPTPPPAPPAAIPELEAVDYSNAIMAVADARAEIRRLQKRRKNLTLERDLSRLMAETYEKERDEARRSLATLRAVLGRVLSDFAALAMTAPWAENVRLQRELQIAELAAEKYGGELAHSSELNGLLLDTNARLRQALDEFGGHKAGCGAACAYKCDCGFAEAVE